MPLFENTKIAPLPIKVAACESLHHFLSQFSAVHRQKETQWLSGRYLILQ